MHDIRHLHSFPTRRSSDLISLPISLGIWASNSSKSRTEVTCRPRSNRIVRISCSRGVADEPLIIRSEEHTSELQSLRHLVCRLLLEKKKQTKEFCTNVANI